MRKLRLRISLIMLLIIAILAYPGVSFADDVCNYHLTRPITMFQQTLGDSCWAVAAGEVIDYYGDSTQNFESAIIYYNFQYAGTPRGIADAINNKFGLTYWDKSASARYNIAPLQGNEIVNQLSKQAPIVAVRKDTNGGLHHAVVVRGYDSISSDHWVEFNDPWDGLIHYNVYNTFLGVWTSSVICRDLG